MGRSGLEGGAALGTSLLDGGPRECSGRLVGVGGRAPPRRWRSSDGAVGRTRAGVVERALDRAVEPGRRPLGWRRCGDVILADSVVLGDSRGSVSFSEERLMGGELRSRDLTIGDRVAQRVAQRQAADRPRRPLARVEPLSAVAALGGHSLDGLTAIRAGLHAANIITVRVCADANGWTCRALKAAPAWTAMLRPPSAARAPRGVASLAVSPAVRVV